MESTNNKKIVSLFPEEKNKEMVFLLQKLIKLLNENDEVWWANVLRDLLKKYLTSENKKEATELIFQTLCSGRGSLLDLTLYKDRQPLREKNKELRALRRKLYDVCEQILYPPGKNIGKNKFNCGDIVKVILNPREIEKNYRPKSAARRKKYQGLEGLVVEMWAYGVDSAVLYVLAFFDEQGYLRAYTRLPGKYLEATGKKGNFKTAEIQEECWKRIARRKRLPVDDEEMSYIPPDYTNWTPSRPLPIGASNGYYDKFNHEWDGRSPKITHESSELDELYTPRNKFNFYDVVKVVSMRIEKYYGRTGVVRGISGVVEYHPIIAYALDFGEMEDAVMFEENELEAVGNAVDG